MTEIWKNKTKNCIHVKKIQELLQIFHWHACIFRHHRNSFLLCCVLCDHIWIKWGSMCIAATWWLDSYRVDQRRTAEWYDPVKEEMGLGGNHLGSPQHHPLASRRRKCNYTCPHASITAMLQCGHFSIRSQPNSDQAAPVFLAVYTTVACNYFWFVWHTVPSNRLFCIILRTICYLCQGWIQVG